MIEESRQIPRLIPSPEPVFNPPPESRLVVQEERAVLRAVLDVNKDAILEELVRCLDLTRLEPTDTEYVIRSLCESAKKASAAWELPSIAAVCIPPHFVSIAAETLRNTNIGIATVVGGFPAGATNPTLVRAEIEQALRDGATEIDLMFPLPLYFAGKDREVLEILQAARTACGNRTLKVILETGSLKSDQNIVFAAEMALASGADFLKTSSGKAPEGASLRAVGLLAHTLQDFYERTGKRVGIKISGGVRTPEQAARFRALVSEVWHMNELDPQFFRLGASLLADSLARRLKPKLQKDDTSPFNPFKLNGDSY
ncbi:MAG: deoxyribose-phosphate aldolase [Bdellovibrionales bacterium]|nr:deoxyribose-phosphate aldolase [Bdellovibrionales bacterium]